MATKRRFQPNLLRSATSNGLSDYRRSVRSLRPPPCGRSPGHGFPSGWNAESKLRTASPRDAQPSWDCLPRTGRRLIQVRQREGAATERPYVSRETSQKSCGFQLSMPPHTAVRAHVVTPKSPWDGNISPGALWHIHTPSAGMEWLSPGASLCRQEERGDEGPPGPLHDRLTSPPPSTQSVFQGAMPCASLRAHSVCKEVAGPL